MTAKKALLLSFASILLLSCEKESPAPTLEESTTISILLTNSTLLFLEDSYLGLFNEEVITTHSSGMYATGHGRPDTFYNLEELITF